jgi:ATP-dependent Clp protease ATP-binding subunit ClpA
MARPNDADSLFLTDGGLRAELLGVGVPAVLQEAVRQADETNWDTVRTPHIFMGLLAVPDAAVCDWGKRLQADLSTLLSQFRELFHQDQGERHSITGFSRQFVSEQVILLLVEALSRAGSRGRTSLVPMDLLVGVFTTKTIVTECFERAGISTARLVDVANLAERETKSPSSPDAIKP